MAVESSDIDIVFIFESGTPMQPMAFEKWLKGILAKYQISCELFPGQLSTNLDETKLVHINLQSALDADFIKVLTEDGVPIWTCD